MPRKIEFDAAAEKELDKLDPQAARRILKFLRERLAPMDDPRCVGKMLSGTRFEELWRFRVGDYRIIASIDDKVMLILVLRIGHRREVYKR